MLGVIAFFIKSKSKVNVSGEISTKTGLALHINIGLKLAIYEKEGKIISSLGFISIVFRAKNMALVQDDVVKANFLLQSLDIFVSRI